MRNILMAALVSVGILVFAALCNVHSGPHQNTGAWATGERIGIGIAPSEGNRLLLPQENDAVTPTLGFGDGNDGFYNSGDGIINVSIAGLSRWRFLATLFGSGGGDAALLLANGMSLTLPGFIRNSDQNTGLGLGGDDTLSLITNGIAAVSVDASQNVGIKTTPTSTFHIDEGTGWGQFTMDGSSGGCLMFRDTDDGGWTECSFLNGTMTCTLDADGVCDGS